MHATPNFTSILHVAQAQAQVDAAIKLWEPSKDSRIQVHDATANMVEAYVLSNPHAFAVAHTSLCMPVSLGHVQSDPFKTLFVSRLSYDATDKKLRKDFEEFGPIKSIKVVQDKTGEANQAYGVCCMLRYGVCCVIVCPLSTIKMYFACLR